VPGTLEREIKLRFDSPEAARTAVVAAGASPLRGRRLQEDCLLDTWDERLRARRSILRLRMESGRGLLTFKGPVQPATMKLREEIETLVGDGEILLRMLEAAGFHVWFRYQKYREEFAAGEVIVAIDETPVGVFVEIEGGEQGIAAMAEALGRRPEDYVLDSYRGLFLRFREERGLTGPDMVFPESDARL
jgi:adenylate cyclase class 2